MTPIVFGEVLYDCFPNNEKVLGGAPFNVAWHLQAFGDQPCFISCVGDDALGRDILERMQQWGLSIDTVMQDSLHPTGQVKIEFFDNEPHYTITPDCAYDFIDKDQLPVLKSTALLYHGTLALRNETSRTALEQLAHDKRTSIFLDVNLREPWWKHKDVLQWLKQARWAKLNEDELHRLFSGPAKLEYKIAELQQKMELELLIVTRGEKGAIACTIDAEISSVVPEPLGNFVDTVGAGDAFTSVIIHGLISGWPLENTLKTAQDFASRIIGIRGATPQRRDFYQQIFKKHLNA